MSTALLSRTRTPAPMAPVRCRIPAVREAVESARGVVRGSLRGERWDLEEIERVVLAVSEALANAVNHGSSPGGAVTVEIAASPSCARIGIADEGRPGAVCPAAAPAAPPPSSERGRGLLIMGALAERLEIRSEGTGTEVRLAFTRPAGLPAADAA